MTTAHIILESKTFKPELVDLNSQQNQLHCLHFKYLYKIGGLVDQLKTIVGPKSNIKIRLPQLQINVKQRL